MGVCLLFVSELWNEVLPGVPAPKVGCIKLEFSFSSSITLCVNTKQINNNKTVPNFHNVIVSFNYEFA